MKRVIVFIMAVALLQGVSAQKFSVRKQAERDTLRHKSEVELSLGDRYYKHHMSELKFTMGSVVLGGLSTYLLVDGFKRELAPMYIAGFVCSAATLMCTGFTIDAHVKKGKCVRVGLNKITVTF